MEAEDRLKQIQVMARRINSGEFDAIIKKNAETNANPKAKKWKDPEFRRVYFRAYFQKMRLSRTLRFDSTLRCDYGCDACEHKKCVLE